MDRQHVNIQHILASLALKVTRQSVIIAKQSSYTRNCSSAPSAGRITDGPTRSSERTPASWKHVNLYGAYSFLDIGDGVDLQELVNLLEAARGRGAAAPD